MPTGQKRQYLEVQCVDCAAQLRKRDDSVKHWSGRCHKCSSKHTASMPHVRETQVRNGLGFIAKHGRIPSPKPEQRSRGEKHYNWKGGVSNVWNKLWATPEYKAWRLAVLERDGFKCVACSRSDRTLHTDHIMPFKLFPELRFELSNGRTLCGSCHKKYGSETKNGKIYKPARFDYSAA